MREITDADETMENNVSNNAGAGTDQDRREEINNAVSFNVDILHTTIPHLDTGPSAAF